MWLPFALVAAAVAFLAFGGGKKGAEGKGRLVVPQAGQTWTLIIQTSRPLTVKDFREWFSAIAPFGAIRGVAKATGVKNGYAATMTFTQNPGPLRIGQETTLVGGTAKLLAAQQAPIG